MASRDFALASSLHDAKTKQAASEQVAVKTAEFYGRESILDAILQSLDSTSRASGLLVTGEAGTGKTALCVELVEPTHDKSASIAKQVLWHWYCRPASSPIVSARANVARFVRHMARDLCNANLVPDYRLALQADSHARRTLEPRPCNADPDQAFRQGVLLPLNALANPPTERCLLVVDGVEPTSSTRGDVDKSAESEPSTSVAHLLAKHRHIFPDWLVLLVTARPDPLVVDSFHGFEEIHLDASVDELDQISLDVQRFILRRIDTDKTLRLGLSRLAAENINEIRVRSNGCFLYLDLLMDAAARGDISFADLRTVPDNLEEAFDVWTDFLPKVRGFDQDLIRLMLSIMAASAWPLSETDLYETTLAVRPNVVVSQLKRQLQLVEKFVSVDSRDRLRFVHPSFVEWLFDSRVSTTFKCDLGQGHAALAVQYSNRAKTLDTKEIKEFAFHMLKGTWDPAMTMTQMASWMIVSGAPIADVLVDVAPSSCDATDVVELLVAAGAKSKSNTLHAAPSMTSTSISDDGVSTSTGVASSVDSQRNRRGGGGGTESSSLIVAATNGDLEGLAALIDTGVDVDAKGQRGRTALNVAVRLAHQPIVAYLVARNANVDVADDDGWTPLHVTASLNLLEIAVYLLEFASPTIDCVDKEGRTPLRAAAWSGHAALARELLDKGANPNREDNLGRTALIAAAYQGHDEIVQYLVERGALVNHADNEGRTALSVAGLCKAKTSRLVADALLKARADVDAEDRNDMTPLSVAAYEGNIRVAEALLEAGANPNHVDQTGKTPLLATTANGHAGLVKLLLFWSPRLEQEDENGRSLLTLAASSGNVDVVDTLIDIGLNVNHADRQGWTPLVHAVCARHERVVRRLVEHGVETNRRDVDGLGVLHVACQAGSVECVDVLVRSGSVDVNVVNRDGVTALRLAALAGQLDIVRRLVRAGARVNVVDKDRRTTLYAVAAQGLPDVARHLLKHGADPNVRDKDGRTAMHVAAWHGYEDLVQVKKNLVAYMYV